MVRTYLNNRGAMFNVCSSGFMLFPILDVRHDLLVSWISQVQCRCALYLGDRCNMTHICVHHIERCSCNNDRYAPVDSKESYHARQLLGSSGGMSVLHLTILHPISATASKNESAISSLAAPFKMRSVS